MVPRTDSSQINQRRRHVCLRETLFSDRHPNTLSSPTLPSTYAAPPTWINPNANSNSKNNPWLRLNSDWSTQLGDFLSWAIAEDQYFPGIPAWVAMDVAWIKNVPTTA